MDVSTITLLLFLCMIIGLFTGIPIAFLLGSIGTIFAYFFWGPQTLSIIPSVIFGKVMMSFGLVAIPLFVLMGAILQESKIAEKLFLTFHMWSGRIGGGLAVAAVVVCTIFAAMTGIGGAGTITMGLIALPAMLLKKYNPRLALGSIGAGGALGIIIPPSIVMIVYGMICQVSVGRLFAAGIGPGFLLACLYVIYILILCNFIRPEHGPSTKIEDRITFKEKLSKSWSVVPPLFLILAVLGSIFWGIATPTEGAAIGAAGSLIFWIATKKASWKGFKEISRTTVSLSGMVMWIILGAYCFATIYTALGAPRLITSFVSDLPFGYWGVFILIQILFFVLGLVLDPGAIVMITAPIVLPIVRTMGYDPVWFGIIFIMNMQMAYISPPFGYNLFYLRSIAPSGIYIRDIYVAIVPFLFLQMLGLVIVCIFPEIALWLPRLIFGN